MEGGSVRWFGVQMGVVQVCGPEGWVVTSSGQTSFGPMHWPEQVRDLFTKLAKTGQTCFGQHRFGITASGQFDLSNSNLLTNVKPDLCQCVVVLCCLVLCCLVLSCVVLSCVVLSCVR